MPPRKLPPTEQIVARYRDGETTGEIAESLNVAPETVVSCLRAAGEPRRSPKEAARVARERGRLKPQRYWLGKKQPPEMVEKRVNPIRGEAHWNWKGGAAARPYRRLIVKERCDQCGSDTNLGIHHRDFDHYNNDPENLQVLCVSCHASLHKQAYWDACRGRAQDKKE